MDPTTGMELTVEFGDGGEVLVEVHGEVDVATAGALRDQLHGLVDGLPQASRIVVDLSGVAFIDAAGAGALMAAAKEARCRRKDLLARSPSSAVRRVQEILGDSFRLPCETATERYSAML